MNKKKIVSTTIMFLVIVSAVVLFGKIFGEENTIVGVAGITAMLSLLDADYTINPIKNTIYFVIIEIGLGFFAYLASLNAFLGLIITFIVIFMILYNFTYNTKKPTYVAFTLGYFFMLYTPVSIEELPNRLLGLLVCGLFIMGAQLLANKNKLERESRNGIIDCVEYIKRELTLILEEEELDSIDDLNDITYKTLRNLSEGIYKRIHKNIELPTLLGQYLFISQCLEGINLTLSKIKNDKDNWRFYKKELYSLKSLISYIGDFAEGKICSEDLIVYIEKFLEDDKDTESKNYFIYKLKESIKILSRDLKGKNDYSLENINKDYFYSQLIYKLNNLKSNISKDSLKFTFALRAAIVTSLGVFVVGLFDLEYGKWMIFSLSAIVQPYLESSKTKGKDRVVGTVVGLIIFVVLFSIFKDSSARTLIILATGYISNYQTRYRNQMVCTTVSALGGASLVTNVSQLSFERLIFVLLGTGIAVLANKIILPYKMSHVTKNEIKKSINLNKKVRNELNSIVMRKSQLDSNFKGMITLNELINKKIYINNATLSSNNVYDFLYNQRMFMDEVRYLINNISEYNKLDTKEFELFYNLDLVQDEKVFEENILKYFDSIKEDENKLLLVHIIEISNNLIETIKISHLIEKEL